MQEKFSRKLFLGFIQVHILHHALKEPVYGLWMMEELRSHGYEMSPGTLYPILHGMERDGLLAREDRLVDGKVRKYYRATPEGVRQLDQARGYLRELIREV